MSAEPTALYTAPVERIGRHEWRLDVHVHPLFGPCTRYRWRRPGERAWRDERDWPTRDANDGATAGLPAGLSRYYRRHRDAVRAALDGKSPVPPRQGELFELLEG